MRCREQTTVPTPGQNQKHYIVGALHAHTSRLVRTEHHRKTSVLFVKLLDQLRRQYRRAILPCEQQFLSNGGFDDETEVLD